MEQEICGIEGCSNKLYASYLCSKHFRKRSTDPEMMHEYTAGLWEFVKKELKL